MTELRACTSDHPRLCGEKACCSQIQPRLQGSPPPMRGKVWCRFFFSLRRGITPAYAGKRKSLQYFRILSEDHPRLCGEKAQRSSSKSKSRGSPPPMRGKAASNRVDMDSAGITPAYAGKRPTTQGLHFFHRDHPRLCGEKYTSTTKCLNFARITPAYAGKSFFFRTSLVQWHGSPPPMRGKD